MNHFERKRLYYDGAAVIDAMNDLVIDLPITGFAAAGLNAYSRITVMCRCANDLFLDVYETPDHGNNWLESIADDAITGGVDYFMEYDLFSNYVRIVLHNKALLAPTAVMVAVYGEEG